MGIISPILWRAGTQPDIGMPKMIVKWEMNEYATLNQT